MQKQYDTLIYIGRFQPFHNAHKATIEYAATLAKRVIVVVGSANQPRDEDNPFTQDERIMMIEASVDVPDIEFVCVENSLYSNTAWAVNLAKLVEPLIDDHARTKLIGHTKDESSFYLQMFPQWGKPVEMPLVEVLDATTIREIYFSDKANMNFFRGVLPTGTIKFLEEFMTKQSYKDILEEAAYIRKYKKQFEHLPYPPVFQTGDAVVFKAGHVLLIRRKAAPGKGLWAFPGGFLDAKKDEDVLECAIRELYEETDIKVPENAIRGSIVEEKVFSKKGRSRRGRVITTAQHIVLSEAYPGLPRVTGLDDAEKAKWRPIHSIKRIEMFEDHWDILQYFLAKTK